MSTHHDGRAEVAASPGSRRAASLTTMRTEPVTRPSDGLTDHSSPFRLSRDWSVESVLSSEAPAVGASAVETVRRRERLLASADRALECEPQVRAFETLLPRDEVATLLDESSTSSRSGPLAWLPIAVKDNIDVAGWPTRAGSHAPRPEPSSSDASVVARLRRLGAVPLGKTRMAEYAYGQREPETRNPWDTSRLPGGTSAGSAVAVATGSVFAALGTDTGGSVRMPAAMCGVAGFKPSRGAIPTDGVVPLSWTLDHVGLLARNVTDLSVVWHAMARTRPRPADGLRGARIGIAKQLCVRSQDDVAASFDRVVSGLRDAGAQVCEVTVPGWDTIKSLVATILMAEASAFHAGHVRACRESYFPETAAAIEQGFAMTAHEYVNALRAGSRLALQVDELMVRAEVDFLVSPTEPTVAPPVGADEVSIAGEVVSFFDAFLEPTVLYNLSGQPAISIPMGSSVDGTSRRLPLGLQIAGRVGADADVLSLARTIEEEVIGPWATGLVLEV